MEQLSICKICESDDLYEFLEFSELDQVTSDCKPWKPGGRLAICMKCSLVQKITDTDFKKSIGEIYSSYTMFHQSNGVEQSVLSSNNDSFEQRSSILCEFMYENIDLQKTGSLLDVGCANGGILKAFNEIKKEWKLFGHDLDTRYLNDLNKIPGFKSLFSGDFSNISGKYEIITIIHAIEHFLAPKPSLEKLKNYLSDQGSLFIEVPNCEINPFDLVVADHVSHFSLKTIRVLLERAGYTIHTIEDNVIYKELTVLAKNNSMERGGSLSIHLEAEALDRKLKVFDEIKWLKKIKKRAKEVSDLPNSFGIFGSSISATWLASSLIDKVDFFIDEDVSRIGKTHLNKPIFSPDEIPTNSNTFIPLVPSLSEKIFKRINSPQYNLYI